MMSTKKLFSWLEKNILELAAGFLLVFIPLYPKWPLTDILPGYIVRIRLEDFLVAAVILVWLSFLIRRKKSIRSNPLTIPIAVYLGIGILSSFSAVLITKTVPMETTHMAKLFLHWMRRVEYMALAFIFFSAIKTKKQIMRFVTIIAYVVIVLTLYGFGQKYFQFPVYSTMNREFAKGWRLVLTEHARVPSTFAGHYDFAAYSVISISIVIGMMFYNKKSLLSKRYFLVFIAALLSLLLTASRTSFIAYLAGASVTIGFLSLRRGYRWGLSRWLGVMTLSIILMFSFGDLSSRFAHFFKVDQIREYVAVELRKRGLLSSEAPIKITDDLALVITETDQPPIPVELPPGVFEEIPVALPEATLSATSAADLERIASMAGKPRTYSQAAFTYGLSSAIRFDALWPRAMKGFLSNPLLGSGYSTLTKTQLTEFTEAESTDNDYLRALGETGLLGFLSFFGIIFFALHRVWKVKSKIKDPALFALTAGIVGAIVGMLINGLYIDVFEASKVAYTFWALMGILFAIINVSTHKS